MRRAIRVLVAGVALAGALASPAFAEEVSLATLLEDPAAFEGEVTVTGEIVGDYGFRGDGWVWAQLNDDSYARDPILEGGALTGSNTGVGLRMPHAMVDDLGSPGGYRRRGPLVEVTAVWRYHDPARGGESYLEATSLLLIEPGRTLKEGPHWGNLVAGATLLAVAGGMWATRRREE